VVLSSASVAANEPCEDRMQQRDRAEDTIVGIFDGHGGTQASQYCREHMLDFFDAAVRSGAPAAEALADAVLQTEAGYLALCREKHARGYSRGLFCGTCALLVHVDKTARALLVSNVGDSRAVLAERDAGGLLSAAAVSFDHSAGTDYERYRLACRFPGRDVVRESYDELNGQYDRQVLGLAMFTRSIGDFQLKHRFAAEQFNNLVAEGRELPMPPHAGWVSSEPHTVFRQLHHKHEFVVAACDGLWDEMSSDAAVHIVGRFFERNPMGTDRDAAAFLLREVQKRIVRRLTIERPDLQIRTVEQLLERPAGKGESDRRNLHDDISVSVVRFDYSEVESSVEEDGVDDFDASHSVRCGPVRKRRNFSNEWDNECSDAIQAMIDSSLTDEKETARELSGVVELAGNPPSTSAELDSCAAVAVAVAMDADADAVHAS
jgi:pyruvate dehydrogenase phosphatase